MYSRLKRLETPKDFKFPYKPYAIQQELMEALYNVLESKKIGIFESPTGTGKSLTLTCAALRWLEDHEELVSVDLQHRINQLENEIKRLENESANTLDWITTQYAAKQQRDELVDLRKVEQLMKTYEERLSVLRERRKEQKKQQISKYKRLKLDEHNETENESDFELQHSDEFNQDDDLDAVDAVEEERYRGIQIFFCSRTHSQLAQVLREVKRTEYGKKMRCISMASRQQLCINPKVKNLPSVGLINERCLDMARCSGSKEKTEKVRNSKCGSATRCLFKNANVVQDLSDTVLTEILDIEDLVEAAEELNACPYYATRAAVSSSMAQLVMVPYQMLLHRRTRQQSGIDLRGSIVIIDEAHNLLDTISQLHSCELTLQQLEIAQQQIVAYKMRYSKRFSTVNLLCINQLLFVIKRLVKLLKSPSKNNTNQMQTASSTKILRAYEVASEGDFFNIDLLRLIEFCESNRFAQKVQGFANTKPRNDNENHVQIEKGASAAKQLLRKLEQESKLLQKSNKLKNRLRESNVLVEASENIERNVKEKRVFSMPSPLHPLLTFLTALTEKAEDGRVFMRFGTDDASFKYMVLNPGHYFEDILKEARAIIIAGGTMRPTNELTEQLFRFCPERIESHFYDHVVPADAVAPFVVQRGPKGGMICYNYASRSNNEMLSELLMILQNLCQVVPAGLVCFFPSYDYLDFVYKQLQNSSNILQNIESRKKIFLETRSNRSNNTTTQTVEQLLDDYAKCIRLGRTSGRGALLLSVVGGKLSEGLNFADDLGRGVIVVGMPYANSKSAELLERMHYLDETLASGAGKEYYENLCMKSVNQCIGRSVRHIHDYAAVYLLDERYAKEQIRKKLPKWIGRSLQAPPNFGLIQAMTAKFFKQKKDDKVLRLS